MKAYKPIRIMKAILSKAEREFFARARQTAYRTNTGLRVIVSADAGLLHISASCDSRLPSWEEMKFLRYELGKSAEYMAIIFPPESEYVDLHKNCLHLWEINNGGTASDGQTNTCD
jgi:hypothetical protein